MLVPILQCLEEAMRDAPKYCNQGVATLDARQRPVIASCALCCISVDHAELETITHRAPQKCHMCSRKTDCNAVPGWMHEDEMYSGDGVKEQIMQLRREFTDPETGYIKKRHIGRAEEACKAAGFRVSILHESASPITFAPHVDVSLMVCKMCMFGTCTCRCICSIRHLHTLTKTLDAIIDAYLLTQVFAYIHTCMFHICMCMCICSLKHLYMLNKTFDAIIYAYFLTLVFAYIHM
jgi:hypothetical protein